MLGLQSTKTFLINDILKIGQKKFLLLVKLKTKFREKIAGSFYEKEMQKTSQGKFRIEKLIIRKGDKLYVKWKRYDNSFNSWTDKNTSYKNESILF